MGLNLLWIQKPQWFGMADANIATRLSFVSVAVWWVVFSIPLFSRPAYLLNSNRVKGPIKNPTQQGSTWNAETWSVTS